MVKQAPVGVIGRDDERAVLRGFLALLEQGVAEGRSNKEVAAALSLTPRTVETKLSRIYAKLGVRSRTELAHRLTQEARATKV